MMFYFCEEFKTLSPTRINSFNPKSTYNCYWFYSIALNNWCFYLNTDILMIFVQADNKRPPWSVQQSKPTPPKAGC